MADHYPYEDEEYDEPERKGGLFGWIRNWLRRRRESQERQLLAVLAQGRAGGWPMIRDSGLTAGTVHVLLARWEHRDGVVRSEWGERVGGDGPRRRMYTLTEKGRGKAQRMGVRT